jgi:hypothetical protein
MVLCWTLLVTIFIMTFVEMPAKLPQKNRVRLALILLVLKTITNYTVLDKLRVKLTYKAILLQNQE